MFVCLAYVVLYVYFITSWSLINIYYIPLSVEDKYLNYKCTSFQHCHLFLNKGLKFTYRYLIDNCIICHTTPFWIVIAIFQIILECFVNLLCVFEPFSCQVTIVLWNESLNNEGQTIPPISTKRNEQITSHNSMNIKTTLDTGHSGLGLGQAHTCGEVKPLLT